MKLKLSDFSNIADIIAAIAIVLSLIYVGIQVTDNTRATRSATANSATAILMSVYAQATNSKETSGLWAKGLTNPSSLDDAEKTQFILLAHSFMLAYQNSYYLSKEGTLDTEVQESISATIQGVHDLPGFQIYWSQRRSLFMSDFRDYVDALLEAGAKDKVKTIYEIPFETRE